MAPSDPVSGYSCDRLLDSVAQRRHYLEHSAHSSSRHRWKWCSENTHIGVCSMSSEIHCALVLKGGHTEEAPLPQTRNHKDIYIQPVGFRL
jgi:hypothetical protein